MFAKVECECEKDRCAPSPMYLHSMLLASHKGERGRRAGVRMGKDFRKEQAPNPGGLQSSSPPPAPPPNTQRRLDDSWGGGREQHPEQLHGLTASFVFLSNLSYPSSNRLSLANTQTCYVAFKVLRDLVAFHFECLVSHSIPFPSPYSRTLPCGWASRPHSYPATSLLTS